MARYVSPSAEQSKLVVTGGGSVSSLYVLNLAASKRWVYVFDGTTDAGTLIAGPYPVDAGAALAIDFSEARVSSAGLEPASARFAAGLFIASSTSGASYAAGGADLRLNVESRGP